jgi:NAD(P)-dependent dehydrogenase (short-subunit alcohol dehydrogenase family)
LLGRGLAVVIADVDREAGEETAAEYAPHGAIRFIPTDVADEPQVRRLIAEAVAAFGGIDILINNAAIATTHGGTVIDLKLEDWNRVLEANLTTAMLCCKYAIPVMRQGGGGSIITVSSIAGARGLSGSPGAVAYATAKAGLFGFTQSIAADYATQNIRSNCIIVGSVATPMVAHMGAEARERRRVMVPMQTEGTAWDIAHGAVYLASDESRWVTGILLPIDGGLINIRAWPR